MGFVFLYLTITSVQNLMAAQEEVDKAQKEYDIAVAENEALHKKSLTMLLNTAVLIQR